MSAYEVARARWPDIDLAHDVFAAFVAERALPDDSAHAADLYLACACLHGLPSALAAFERTLLARLPAFLAKLQPSQDLIDELKQRVREKLFTGARAKIAEYAGKGTLEGWLRIVVLRLAVDLQRGHGQREQPLEWPAELALAQSSPELQALRNRYRPLFRDAFIDAMTTLSTDERLLLRLHFVDGLSTDELGKLFKVNRSTIFRRLGSVTAALHQAIGARLGETLALSPSELDSLAALVQDDLDISLGGLLRSR